MHKTIIALCLIAAGCATTKTAGLTADQLASLCRAEGNSMVAMGYCFEGKMNVHHPMWQKDGDAVLVKYLVSYAKALGDRVYDDGMDDSKAYDLFKQEIRNISASKQAERSEAYAQQRARSQAAMTGAILINSMQTQRAYAPQAPLIQYPQDQTINIQTQQPYRFIDSSPYR